LIRIRVSSRGDSALRLRVTGHAGFAAAGNDVLCAAVSVLAENLGESLRLLLNADLELEEGDGLYDVRLSDAAASRETDLLFASAILGLRSIALAHPDRIVFESEELE